MYKSMQPLIIAVGGAKGGVGKSLVCSNLAIQYAQQGLEVALLDLDFGAANLHTLFGLSSPSKGWSHFFEDTSQSLKAYLTPTKQKNLSMLPASGFVPEMADLAYQDKVHLIEKIKTLKVDVIFLDLGAGSSKDMVDFFSIADLKLLVTTTEPTALMNNFEFIKNVLYRTLKRLFQGQEKLLALLEEFKKDAKSSLGSFLHEVEKVEPWQAESAQSLCDHLNICMVFNQIRRLEETKAALRFKKICEKQLKLHIEFPGFVFYNEAVAHCVQKMLPISLVLPHAITSLIFKRMAHHLMRLQQKEKSKEVTSFAWSYLTQDFKKNTAEEKKHQLSKNLPV